MALRLTIISEQNAALGDRATLILDAACGTIGRADDNDVVVKGKTQPVAIFEVVGREQR